MFKAAAGGSTKAAGDSAESLALAADLAAAAPQRRVTLARELTKQFETIVTAPAAELPAWLAADDHRQRGEFVLVLHALPPTPAAAAALAPATDDSADTERVLRLLLAELPLKSAVKLAADITGAPRNALYPWALAERGHVGPGDDDADNAVPV